jgi:intein-encoded DNA endonuclease-like protein
MWEANQVVRYYKASELNPKIQQRLLEERTDFIQEVNNREYYSIMKNTLAKVFNEDIVLHYSLGFSQGDGASFLPEEGQYSIRQLRDLVKRAHVAKNEDLDLHEAKVFDIIAQLFDLVTIVELNLIAEVMDNDNTEPYIAFEQVGRYCHKHSVVTSLEEDNWYDLEETMPTATFKAYMEWLNNVYNKFEKARITICDYIETVGYEYIYEEVTIQDLDEYDFIRDVVYTAEGAKHYRDDLEADGVTLTLFSNV